MHLTLITSLRNWNRS